MLTWRVPAWFLLCVHLLGGGGTSFGVIRKGVYVAGRARARDEVSFFLPGVAWTEVRFQCKARDAGGLPPGFGQAALGRAAL